MVFNINSFILFQLYNVSPPLIGSIESVNPKVLT